MITLYHGTTTDFADALIAGESVRPGFCLAPKATTAAAYTWNGAILEIEIDLSDLIVTELDSGYERDSNIAPADADVSEFVGMDVLVFEDEDPHGANHTTYRLISERALERVRIIDNHDSEDAQWL